MSKEIRIKNAILDIVKDPIDGKDLLVIEQVDNKNKGIQYIYIENFRIQDWREDPIGGKHITFSN
jgi:hypothetical protein